MLDAKEEILKPLCVLIIDNSPPNATRISEFGSIGDRAANLDEPQRCRREQ